MKDIFYCYYNMVFVKKRVKDLSSNPKKLDILINAIKNDNDILLNHIIENYNNIRYTHHELIFSKLIEKNKIKLIKLLYLKIEEKNYDNCEIAKFINRIEITDFWLDIGISFFNYFTNEFKPIKDKIELFKFLHEKNNKTYRYFMNHHNKVKEYYPDKGEKNEMLIKKIYSSIDKQ